MGDEELLHPQFRVLQDILRARAVPPADPVNQTITVARAAAERYGSIWNAEKPAVALVLERTIPGPVGVIRVRFYVPESRQVEAPVILYFHGGGYALNSVDTHDRLLRKLTQESGAVVVAPFYSRAPEHRFPIQIYEAQAVINWLRAEGRSLGVDGSRFALAGDSAGAHLALTTALSLPPHVRRDLKGLALLYGMYGYDFSTPSYRRFGDGRFGLSTERMRWYWQTFLGTDQPAPNPLALPLYAELGGLPPVHLAAAGLDVLLDDSLTLAARLSEAGVKHSLAVYPGVPHAFAQMGHFLDAGDDAVKSSAHFLARALSPKPPPSRIADHHQARDLGNGAAWFSLFPSIPSTATLH